MDEEAAFEEGLEDVHEVLALVAEAFAETLFDLGEDVVEIGADEGVDGAFDRGEEEAVLAAADDGGIVVGELEGFTEFAVLVLKFFDEAGEVVFDLARGGVARGIVAGV